MMDRNTAVESVMDCLAKMDRALARGDRHDASCMMAIVKRLAEQHDIRAVRDRNGRWYEPTAPAPDDDTTTTTTTTDDTTTTTDEGAPQGATIDDEAAPSMPPWGDGPAPLGWDDKDDDEAAPPAMAPNGPRMVKTLISPQMARRYAETAERYQGAKTAPLQLDGAECTTLTWSNGAWTLVELINCHLLPHGMRGPLHRHTWETYSKRQPGKVWYYASGPDCFANGKDRRVVSEMGLHPTQLHLMADRRAMDAPVPGFSWDMR